MHKSQTFGIKNFPDYPETFLNIRKFSRRSGNFPVQFQGLRAKTFRTRKNFLDGNATMPRWFLRLCPSVWQNHNNPHLSKAVLYINAIYNSCVPSMLVQLLLLTQIILSYFPPSSLLRKVRVGFWIFKCTVTVFFRLGDILPQDILPQRTKCPETKCPKDILPQLTWK